MHDVFKTDIKEIRQRVVDLYQRDRRPFIGGGIALALVVIVLVVVAARPSPSVKATVAAATTQDPRLFDAITAKADAAAIGAMLTANPELLKVNEPTGKTPLHAAALAGDASVVQLLLDRGLAVDVKESSPLKAWAGRAGEGATPLHYAILNGQLEAVKVLLKAGADTAAAMADGRIVVDLARISKNKELKTLVVTEHEKRYGKDK